MRRNALGDWDIWGGAAGNEPRHPGGICLHFCLTDQVSPADCTVLLSWLDTLEQERRRRFASDRGRRLFGIAHGLTRYCLSLWTAARSPDGTAPVHPGEWRFAAEPFGRPRALLPPGTAPKPPAPVFSLSHARDAVAVAVAAGGQVGTDVENVGRRGDFPSLAERFFAPEERAHVAEAGDSPEGRRRFLQYWTLKESYLKALGLGMNKSMSSFALMAGPGTAERLHDRDGTGGIWDFRSLSAPGGMIVSLAARRTAAGEIPYVRLRIGESISGWSEPIAIPPVPETPRSGMGVPKNPTL
ncbi:MAG: 4'-phosphopantetheinyl transferase superfamily protein [Planctomycetota bacterium]|jgi:4'-phosphopantetheinyl transferase|nr:4'-phosphopantetheinyl transferase superfamily protein [Planctomycetota bacterium]